MKYLIVGTGGTGACIGSFLAKKGHDVTFIARGKHLQAIHEKGLTIKSDRIAPFNLKPVKAMTTEEYIQSMHWTFSTMSSICRLMKHLLPA